MERAAELEVTDFIIVAPTNKGKAVEMAKERLADHLVQRFPALNFRIEPFGPLSDEDSYAILPIRKTEPIAGATNGAFTMSALPSDELLIQIYDALRDFDLEGIRAN